MAYLINIDGWREESNYQKHKDVLELLKLEEEEQIQAIEQEVDQGKLHRPPVNGMAYHLCGV